MTDYTEDAPVRHRIRYNPTRRGGEAAYDAAQRHSRLVRRLKILLPLLAAGGIAVFWASARYIPGDIAGLITSTIIDVKTKSIVMTAPHISGFEGTRRAYEMKATRAVQSIKDPKVLTFEKISGHIGLDDGSTATVDAAIGIYNGNNNTITLKNGITAKTTSGYSAKLKSASINLDKGNLQSSQPVEIHTKEGTVRANSIVVVNRGKHIRFRGNVSVTFTPPGKLATAPEAK